VNILTALWGIAGAQILFYIIKDAYNIRLYAVNNYGRIIHEFDPYFNFRATEYLYEHGWQKFATWFDYKVWYPLGRPVGTTIYPGMQVTAVFLKRYIFGDNMSLNDICVFMPAWFGGIATVCTGLLAYECSVCSPTFGSVLLHIPVVNVIYKKVISPIVDILHGIMMKTIGTDFGLKNTDSRSKKKDMNSPAVECGICAAAVMSIVPAHILRSIGGGFDNESVAMTAMTLTFYVWTRSLRGHGSEAEDNTSAWRWGILTGVAYFNMVAAWGGYVFVLNLIGCHAAVLFLIGRYTTKLYRAYSTFYVVGTLLALQIPVVGLTPLKSLEQLAPCALFCGFQFFEFCEYMKRRNNLSNKQSWLLRIKVFTAAALVGGVVLYLLVSGGYFGPISSRVRGLFVQHTKTGNPLVDSVAEHQPASTQAYFQYLDIICYLAPVGLAITMLFYFTDSSSFLAVYALAAYFFSHKMVRLILLTAPIASVCAGIFLGRVAGWMIKSFIVWTPPTVSASEDDTETNDSKSDRKSKKSKSNKDENKKSGNSRSLFGFWFEKITRMALTVYALKMVYPKAKEFHGKCHQIAESISHPAILFNAKTNQGDVVVVDDYREAYFWLRDNTPEDARIMAWWDYGYQITAMANRTTIADGNTWNHEHIALLGRALTSPEKEGHRIARHLADYMLVWAGGGGDDLAKSPHLARIANSVYRHMCPNDPTCAQFYMSREGPSQKIKESMLYKLHSHGLQPGVQVDPNRFKEVFRSQYQKVRIFKVLSVSRESKKWVANPENRLCDVPGSWYCPGQYPPALQKILAEKKDFAQLEDFNKKEGDEDYQKQYFENLKNPQDPKRGINMNQGKEQIKPSSQKKQSNSKQSNSKREVRIPIMSKEDIESVKDNWEDNSELSMIWDLIKQNDIHELFEWLETEPLSAYMRSADGRGPMWWAHEFGHADIVRLLKSLGISETDRDVKGLSALDISKKGKKRR